MSTDTGIIVKNPAILSGEPIFRGTRVPFKSLTDYLERGHTLGEFLDDFPGVSREGAIAALEQARSSLVATLKMKLLQDECLPRKLTADHHDYCERD